MIDPCSLVAPENGERSNAITVSGISGRNVRLPDNILCSVRPDTPEALTFIQMLRE